MRLNQFDYFRAIAILIIVSGHNIDQMYVIDTFFEKVLANLIAGGTSLFVFISGFFFYHIFYGNFNFKNFMLKKIRNVYLPYIVMTTVAMILYLICYKYMHNWTAQEVAKAAVSWQETVMLYIEYILFGGICPPYWYVSFIMIIFLLSPIFIRYIKLPLRIRLSIYAVFFVISTIIMRPITHLTPFHSVLYFIPMYLLGINVSINRNEVANFIDGKAWMFGLLALLFAMIQAQFTDVVGIFEKGEIFSYKGVNIMFIQKTALIFFFLSFLQRYENKNIPLLKVLADASFALYFLHEFVKLALKAILVRLNVWEPLHYLPETIGWVLLVTVVVYLNLLIAQFIKSKLGFKSRYVIGW